MLLHLFPLPSSQIEAEKQVVEDLSLEAANSILVQPLGKTNKLRALIWVSCNCNHTKVQIVVLFIANVHFV